MANLTIKHKRIIWDESAMSDQCFRQTWTTWYHWIEMGAARTRAPAVTNYDVHSPAWGDARASSPSGGAMEAPALSHRPSWSPIDPAQVSMFWLSATLSFYSPLALHPLYVGRSYLASVYSPWHARTTVIAPPSSHVNLPTHYWWFTLTSSMFSPFTFPFISIDHTSHAPTSPTFSFS